MDVPEWQIEQVKTRLEEYKNNAEQATDFDKALVQRPLLLSTVEDDRSFEVFVTL